MNLWSSAIGGIPMCHGAGGMAGHVRFGAHTGGSSIMLGVVLLATGLFLGDSVALLFKLFPPAVLGIILFLAGVQLALGGKDGTHDKADRLVVLTTAAFAIWNVGIAVLFGIFVYHASKRGWIRL
jgi:MFS superfamily sulfate permease-like transporter